MEWASGNIYRAVIPTHSYTVLHTYYMFSSILDEYRIAETSCSAPSRCGGFTIEHIKTNRYRRNPIAFYQEE